MCGGTWCDVRGRVICVEGPEGVVDLWRAWSGALDCRKLLPVMVWRGVGLQGVEMAWRIVVCSAVMCRKAGRKE